MRLDDLPPQEQWDDLLRALEFAQRRFTDWVDARVLSYRHLATIQKHYDNGKNEFAAAQVAGADFPEDTGLPKGHVGESAAFQSLRYWTFVAHEVRRFTDNRLISLAQSHAIMAEIRERQAVLQRRVGPDELPQVLPAKSAQPRKLEKAPVIQPVEEVLPARRNLLEILLDPRNIQMLLAFGGALMVVGLVILLWVNQFFTPPVVAVGLGAANGAMLLAGWWLLRSTRYQLAGRALTLLACLVMPLNLWYYHANGFITLDGHLWVAALVISALYATSALVLQDELFVYTFMLGITLTGLLLLADLPPSPQKFWEIASPATLLVVLGLLAIHAERAFPEQEGPFGRRRFGLAFFWSGQVLLASGLLLVLGAQIAGDWLYQPVFRNYYQEFGATPSPIVGELRWLALALVIAGTYGYIYSDLVVRHIGVYVSIAAGTLMWAFVLALQLLDISMGVDALIIVLAGTALVVNLVQATALRDSRYTKVLPTLGVLLPLLAVGLGLLVYLRAVSTDLKSVWGAEPPAWSYVWAMLLTAVSCRIGAHLYRESEPRLSATYFFATAAATLVGATALLAVLGLNTWQEHAPWLMLIPIAYLIAARLYRGGHSEQPLLWVAHAATAVMLFSSLASAVEGFVLVQERPLNLVLALFFVEAAVFYILATVLHRQAGTIHLAAAMVCAALWQVLTYRGVSAEFYTLTFALVGLALLVVYRFAVVERFAAGPVADAAFASANTLLSVAFVAALLLGLSRFATDDVDWGRVRLFTALTAIGLLALMLVRHMGWRRWYVVMTVAQAGLAFLGVTVLSDLSFWQKLEIFCVGIGVLLLVVGHVGWYREQDRQNDLVSVSLILGSLLVGIPLALATLIDRSRDDFIILNELGFLVAALFLVTSGFLLQLKATTLIGAGLTALYFVTLLIYVPWSRLNAVAVLILAGGGTLFLVGLLLSVYRDRLLTLPDRIRRREGLFRVLNWR